MASWSEEDLAAFAPWERRMLRFADAFQGDQKWVSELWISTFMRSMLWFSGGRRYRVEGEDVLASFGPEDRVLLVANHRSFFDFFVVTFINVTRSRLGRRAFFPVRSSFFYEHALGGVVNLLMSGMMMYPPVFRDRKHLRFNLLALRRLVEELQVPGTVVGIHPEGTRGKGPDPYELLPVQFGVGRVALEAKGARVIPIFIVGMSSNLALETLRNWLSPEAFPIDIEYGPDIELDDLRAKAAGSRRAKVNAERDAAERCMSAIRELGARVRARRGSPVTVSDATQSAAE
ncbi:MAG: 1-acyl-sn-glycerol-3-phosphate acyltransferase [Polyangiaceae bacterium]|nr:1-acyl-sn-glycerol-3-phosphate acyltransferase [Polyangiaceae bacterium]MCB9609300.1 1-acyl-sn-glycerol-3-phosphate acyltransferase [Polyangiaceae bacterium]